MNTKGPRVDTETRLCGIVGDPIAHSKSPKLHNAAFSALGLNYVYLAFRVQKNEVKRVFDAMRAMDGFVGLSITIPHKQEAVNCVDIISTIDSKTGSINTIVKENGKLRGFGTDGPGARAALEKNGMEPKGKEVTILGTGGSARAIAFDMVFNSRPAGINLAGRTESRIEKLAGDLSKASEIPVEGLSMLDESALDKALESSSILINTTPVGMHPNMDATPVDASLLHEGLSVMDIIYNPLDTRLVREAKEKGLEAAGGIDMFINQAAIQFNAWTGSPAPLDVIKKAVL